MGRTLFFSEKGLPQSNCAVSLQPPTADPLLCSLIVINTSVLQPQLPNPLLRSHGGTQVLQGFPGTSCSLHSFPSPTGLLQASQLS